MTVAASRDVTVVRRIGGERQAIPFVLIGQLIHGVIAEVSCVVDVGSQQWRSHARASDHTPPMAIGGVVDGDAGSRIRNGGNVRDAALEAHPQQCADRRKRLIDTNSAPTAAPARLGAQKIAATVTVDVRTAGAIHIGRDARVIRLAPPHHPPRRNRQCRAG